GQWVAASLAAIEENTSAIRFVKLQHQCGDGRLTRAAWSYDRYFLARSCLKRNMFQHRDFAARRIGKGNVFEGDVSLYGIFNRLLFFQQADIFLLFIKNFDDPL